MKPTKKSLREALKPLREKAEREGLAWMGGSRPVRHEIEWDGLPGYRISFMLVRRARVVCNVPAPYSAMEINYDLRRLSDGRVVASYQNGAEFIDGVFRLMARGVL